MHAKWVLRDPTRRSGQALLADVSGLAVDSEPILFPNEPGREAWIALAGPDVFGLGVHLERSGTDAQWILSVKCNMRPEYSRRQVAGMAAYALTSLLLAIAAWKLCGAAFSDGGVAVIAALAVLNLALWGFVHWERSKWLRPRLDEEAEAAAMKTAADRIEKRVTALCELDWKRIQ